MRTTTKRATTAHLRTGSNPSLVRTGFWSQRLARLLMVPSLLRARRRGERRRAGSVGGKVFSAAPRGGGVGGGPRRRGPAGVRGPRPLRCRGRPRCSRPPPAGPRGGGRGGPGRGGPPGGGGAAPR